MKDFFIRSVSSENAKEILAIAKGNKLSHGGVINMVMDYIRANEIKFQKETKVNVTKKAK